MKGGIAALVGIIGHARHTLHCICLSKSCCARFSQADVTGKRLRLLYEPCCKRFDLEHPSTPALPPIRNRIETGNQAFQAAAHDRHNRLPEQTAQVAPMCKHLGQLIASRCANIGVVARLDLSEA
jgi:hypothetical protein